tara:strand:+ start:238 stop:1467 length:1230 start_codon:yes stop_codon:yes gene_type:complete
VDIIISKNELYSESDKVFSIKENNFVSIDEPNDLKWSYGITNQDTFNIIDLFKLNNINLKLDIPQKFIASLTELHAQTNNIPWEYILPDSIYQELILGYTRNISRHFKQLDTDYYTNTFKPTNDFLSTLKAAKVNRKKLLKYIRSEENKTSISNIETFVPNDDGYCRNTVCSRFASRTGRLVVKDGPRILLLKKDYKDMFESRFENGKIMQFDYVSFEARLALSVAGKHCDSEDVYQFINKEIFSSRLDRNLVKDIVLSTLYGMKTENLSSKLRMDVNIVREYANKIKEYFCFDETYTKLLDDLKRHNNIKSYYGRKINIENYSPGGVYNSYVQSTGVDAALLGFNNITRFTRKNNLNFVPLFTLHDALIADISPELFKHMDKIKSLGETIPDIDNKFYLSHTSLCTSD